MKTKRHKSLLGLSIDGQRLHAAVLSRSGDRLEVKQQTEGLLALDPLTAEPELAGKEIRDILDAAGIKETNCVACAPLKWALTAQCALPDLSEEDLAGFLELQAEREFPFPPDDLNLWVSRFAVAGGGKFATMAALPAGHTAALERALKAAGLRTVSITLSVMTLTAAPAEHAIELLIHDGGVGLRILTGGGVAALRSLDESVVDAPGGPRVDVSLIARQLRITLGQLPQTIRDGLKTVRVFGEERLARAVIDELPGAVSGLSLWVERGDAGLGNALPDALRDGASSAALLAAARRLLGQAEAEFLPPRVSKFQQVVSQVSARGALWLGIAMVSALLVAGGGFAYQWRTLSVLDAKWQEIGPSVKEVEELQGRIRQFRPWCDDTITSLSIMVRLAEAFPEQGDVWAQSISINNEGVKPEVSCTVSANRSGDMRAVCDRLRMMKGFENLQIGAMRGERPVQFSFKFTWNQEASNGVK